MVQATPRPIGQTTITRHTTPARLQAPNAATVTSHRMVNATVAQIRPGSTTIVQTSNIHQSTPPALQPVSATLTQSGFTPGGAQVFLNCLRMVFFLSVYDFNKNYIFFIRYDHLRRLSLLLDLPLKHDNLHRHQNNSRPPPKQPLPLQL